MQALIFTPHTVARESSISQIAGINTAGKFEQKGFTIQLRDIEELRSKYRDWIEVTLTSEEEGRILQMDLATLGAYIQNLIARSSKKIEDIISTDELVFA